MGWIFWGGVHSSDIIPLVFYIGKDYLVGVRTIILLGETIGGSSIVAAGAVVSKDCHLIL